MMFQLFEAIAGSVRDQAADYSKAQARIVARTLTQAANPFGFALAGIAASPLPMAFDEPEACTPPARSAQRVRRGSHATAGRSRRRRPVLNVA